jgi:hypothetical protein
VSDFFRFPHIPHLAWWGESPPRDDKLLSSAETHALLAGDVVVEEKLDGANLGFSLGFDGRLRAQNRGQYLVEPYSGQFARLPSWLARHVETLEAVLDPGWMLFGEWCAARHSLHYRDLPDWFLLFDVYERRNTFAQDVGLATVPEIFRGRTDLAALRQCMCDIPSRYRSGHALEGLVIRRESDVTCLKRAKLVRPDFVQAIDTHWRRRNIEWNQLGNSVQTSR